MRQVRDPRGQGIQQAGVRERRGDRAMPGVPGAAPRGGQVRLVRRARERGGLPREPGRDGGDWSSGRAGNRVRGRDTGD